MQEAKRLSRPVLVGIWGFAILVTVVGGSWHIPTSDVPQWKFDIQFPGSFADLYLGWFIGPLQRMMSPPIVCVLTIMANTFCYYAIIRAVLFLAGALRGEER